MSIFSNRRGKTGDKKRGRSRGKSLREGHGRKQNRERGEERKVKIQEIGRENEKQSAGEGHQL